MTAEAETIIDSLPADSPRRTELFINPIESKPAAPTSKSTYRTSLWIGAGVFAAICVLAVAIGAFRMFSNRSTTTNPNETANPVSTQPVVNSSTADVNAPPSAEGMVEISSDTYEVGIPNPSDEYHSEALSISLPGFWIDKYQVTNSDYKKYIDATGSQPPVISGNENQPVRGVTWDQAAA